MSDALVRTRSTVTESTNPVPDIKRPHTGSETAIEVPYTDYTQHNANPYLVDYFKLGDTWSEAQGGFTEEIAILDDYITEKVKSGDIPNSVTGVKDFIKGIEKMTNMTKEERATIKVETLAAYVDFLMKTDDIKDRSIKYANT